MTEKLRQLNQAIQSMIEAVKNGDVQPDRTWSTAFNALWKKREELEAEPTLPTQTKSPT